MTFSKYLHPDYTRILNGYNEQLKDSMADFFLQETEKNLFKEINELAAEFSAYFYQEINIRSPYLIGAVRAVFPQVDAYKNDAHVIGFYPFPAPWSTLQSKAVHTLKVYMTLLDVFKEDHLKQATIYSGRRSPRLSPLSSSMTGSLTLSPITHSNADLTKDANYHKARQLHTSVLKERTQSALMKMQTFLFFSTKKTPKTSLSSSAILAAATSPTATSW
jgi:hypothetical protein